jgi:hypothetical protein
LSSVPLVSKITPKYLYSWQNSISLSLSNFKLLWIYFIWTCCCVHNKTCFTCTFISSQSFPLNLTPDNTYLNNMSHLCVLHNRISITYFIQISEPSAENCALLVYYTARSGNLLPTFRHKPIGLILMVQAPENRIEKLYRNVGKKLPPLAE